jgi:KaiC/GvpD/RAD55 family RecA-like ATPase
MTVILEYVSEKEDYLKKILSLIKKTDEKVCYVTFNKTCGFLHATLVKKKIDTDKVYFVDCISETIKKPKSVKNCQFVSAPYELEEIGKEIKKAIRNGCTIVIFDSLSNVLTYKAVIPAGMDLLVRLIKSFLPSLNRKQGKAIFICNLKDKGNLLIKETIPIFSKIN